ncbi:MAG: NF038122 family metalloprotease [Alphaproteobacteria bacterium]|nr:NF038122 family metalloprotease [Alphaproteobacteria bacterium]
MTKQDRRSIAFWKLPLAAVTFPLLFSAPAQALVIDPIFDASITSLSNASAVESAFNAVAADYASAFNNPVTVYIGVSWGSVGGYSLPSNALGASLDPLYGYYSYNQVRNALTNASRGNPSDTALAIAAANLPAFAPSGTSRYAIPSAEAKALGLISGSTLQYDGYIGMSGSSTANYDYNPADGITPGTYDFEAVAAHEIAEVLGRITGLNGNQSAYRTPFDLYRYSAARKLGFSYNASAYFSIDGGRTDLGDFNNAAAGGDRSDWLTLATSSDAQDAFIAPGQSLYLSAADLTALDALGWGGSNLGDTGWASPTMVAFNLVDPIGVPEPGTLAALAAALLGLSVARRHGRNDRGSRR